MSTVLLNIIGVASVVDVHPDTQSIVNAIKVKNVNRISRKDLNKESSNQQPKIKNLISRKDLILMNLELSDQPISSDFNFDLYEEQFKRRFKRQLKQRIEAKLRKNANAIFDLIDECLL
jgi:hypothetical protein